MTDEYLAIRAYIVTATQTAWTGVTVIKAQDALERPGQFALVQLDGNQEIRSTGPLVDELEFNFVIIGRFTLASGADAELEALTRVSTLRTQLQASKNPGTTGYLPQVTGYSVDAQSAGDNRYEVLVNFRVMSSTSRT